VPTPCRAHRLDRVDLRSRHERRALGHEPRRVVGLHDQVVRALAEVEPDRGHLRNDIRLISTIDDDVVRAFGGTQVLSLELPRLGQHHDRIESGAAAPRRPGGVRRFPGEAELHGDERVAAALSPRRVEVRRNVREEIHVDAIEHPVPHEERLRPKLLLGDPRPDEQRAVDVLPLHQLLHVEGRHDVHGLPRVVPLTVSRCHREDRATVAHARLLIRLRNPIDIRTECDDR